MAVPRRPASGARGQHFLRSSRLAADLAGLVGLTRDDLVVEIGAGRGVLTRALALTGASVVALESDRALVADLRRRFDGKSRATVVEADARTWPWPARPFVVVANLPFAGAAAILTRLLEDRSVRLERALLIVQWEWAAKHAAVWPSTLRAVFWRAWYEVTIAGRLDATAFSPTPSVSGAVLLVRRRAHPLLDEWEHDAYRRFLHAAFQGGAPIRRTPPPGLTSLEVKRLAPVLGFAPDALPRDLDARQWAALFRAGRAAGGSYPVKSVSPSQ